MGSIFQNIKRKIFYAIFAPDMRSNWNKNLMIFCLLIIYINRGFFVAMPGIEISVVHPTASTEINSLLEIILNLAGSYNEVDEDGDSPESYAAAKTAQPLMDPSLLIICSERPYTPAHKIFFIFDEIMLLSDTYGTIDHPPEIFDF